MQQGNGGSAAFKFFIPVLLLIWTLTQKWCNANMYYIEMYRPWFHRYPTAVRYPHHHYGYLDYDSFEFPFTLRQHQRPFYFGSISYPASLHIEPVIQQQNSLTELHESPKPQAEPNNSMEITEGHINEAHKLDAIKENKDLQQATKGAGTWQIETSKDSSSDTRDKSLLVNIFDQSFGNRKGVNILSYFPNFKLTRITGSSKTISLQGLSVG